MRSKANPFIICPSCNSRLELSDIQKELCYIMPDSVLAYIRLICPICGYSLKKKVVGDKQC